MDAPPAANQELFVGPLQEAPRGIGIRRARGFRHLLQRQSVVGEPGWIDQHLVLLGLAADDHHLRNAGDAEQARAHDPIGQAPQLHRRGRLARHRDEHDLAHRRGDRTEHRRRHARGDAHLLQLLGDELAGAVDVGAELELDEHDRDADRRVGTDAKDPGGAVHRRLDRQRDEGFDLFRRQPVRLGEDGDGGGRQVGEDVNMGAECREAAVDEQSGGGDDDEEPVRERPLNDSVQHLDTLRLGIMTRVYGRLRWPAAALACGSDKPPG